MFLRHGGNREVVQSVDTKSIVKGSRCENDYRRDKKYVGVVCKTTNKEDS